MNHLTKIQGIAERFWIPHIPFMLRRVFKAMLESNPGPRFQGGLNVLRFFFIILEYGPESGP